MASNDDQSVYLDADGTTSKGLWKSKGVLIAAAFILAAMVGFLLTNVPDMDIQPRIRWAYCGETPAEARRRGCYFDVLSFAWQTPECYDHDTAEAFRYHNGSWSYFVDPNREHLQSEEDVMSGEHDTFVTAGFHFTHCTYMWRQLHRAYSLLGYIDEHLDSWNHTLHCQSVLLRGRDMNMEEINTLGRVIYPRCRKLK